MLQLPTSRLVLLHKSQAPFLSKTPSKLQQLSPRGIKILFSRVCGVPPRGFIVLKHHALDHLVGWGFYHKTARGKFAKPVTTSSPCLTGCPLGRAPGGLSPVSLQRGRQCLELLSQAQGAERKTGNRHQHRPSGAPVYKVQAQLLDICQLIPNHSQVQKFLCK